MKILAADDERLALKALVDNVTLAVPGATIYSFQKPRELLEFAKDNPCDIAFLDIQMRGINGIDVAKELKEIQPGINVIFVTGFSDYAVEAFKMHANGYLMKPVTAEDIKKEIEHIVVKKDSVEEKPESKSKLYVQCFGAFEVFFNGKPVEFNRSKAKEVFAYLVHRNGAAVNSPDIAGIIWEDGIFDTSRQKQLQTIISDLRKTFSEIGYEDIVIRNKLGLSVNKKMFDCDVYRFVKGDVDAINSYLGEYMTNYYWAEFTTDYLDTMKMGDK